MCRQIVCIAFVIFWFTNLGAEQDTSSFDPQLLKEIVISDFRSLEKLRSPNSFYSIGRDEISPTSGAASMVELVPGMFVDGSPGEVFSRVHTRGISLSAEEDQGWYYNSLQEDGLPVVAVQFSQFSPDFFLRPSIAVDRMEVLKGGKSGILAPNSPGGIINFIHPSFKNSYYSMDKLSLGTYDNGHIYGRIEGISGGPIGEKGWGYDFSYLYRYDRGARNTPYKMNDGGQLKASLYKSFNRGLFSFRVKWLDDQVNRYLGLAATNWDDPEPAFGQDFSSTSLLPPGLESTVQIPDGRDPTGNSTYEYNPSNGIQSKEIAGQASLDLSLGKWQMREKLKFSSKNLDWQTVIGGQPLGLANFLTYFISGDPFPGGLVAFRETTSGNTLSLVNNIEAFLAFQGLPPDFEYVSGSLPNDAILGSGTWKKDDSIDEWMNELQFILDGEKTDVTLGSFFSRSDVGIFTNASFLYSTYEPQPRNLQVILQNPGEPERRLSDENGVSNYGGLFYEAAAIDVIQFSIFGEVSTAFSDRISADAGFRIENIWHNGSKDRFAPLTADGGVDGNPLTSFDGGPLGKVGEDAIDYNYNYLSWSAALHFELTPSASLYMRYSSANKAPELNYYVNNYSNVPIAEKGAVQNIDQLELGLKKRGNQTSLAVAAFYSTLSNVPFSEFVFDSDNNTIFYTPTQLNSSKNIGIEIEWDQQLTNSFGYDISMTLQDSELDEFSLYQANGTTNTSDDSSMDFSGNSVPHNPAFLGKFGMHYESKGLRLAASWKYISSRYANYANAFKMAGFHTFDLALGFDLSEKVGIGAEVRNAFNSNGFINFFGPNEFGSNANQATAEYVNGNPNGSFVVFPILPRAYFLTVTYSFRK